MTDLEYRATIIRGLFNAMMSSRLQLLQRPDAPFFGTNDSWKMIGDKVTFTLAAYSKKLPALEKKSKHRHCSKK